MPKDNSIEKVLVIGSGAIVIGQAAEFDYSGTQACHALREEGIEVVLANSNPATIMTDKEVADKIYLEPLTLEFLEKIIDKERPDSLLAGMGGQTGLNLALELSKKGILEKYRLRVIGTDIDAIEKGEDRDAFRKLMKEINQPVIESDTVKSIEDGINYAEKIGYPVVVRPAYTLGGTGGGIAENEDELISILKQGLSLSLVHQVLIEKSVKGWKEIEYEVIRDSFGNCITVCSMENIDPVGIHTGDSIVVAPVQTLSDKEHQMLRKASIDIINSIGIKGGCNVQFALNPLSFEYAVIEINPRVSRSSALASKATGYPIAKVAAKIALGYGLDEIKNVVTGKTYACFEPSLDYVVVKIPKWPFDKFKNADRTLGTKMMATGEIMSIGSNFEAAFLKGIRSLENGKFTLDTTEVKSMSLVELKEKIRRGDDERIFCLAEMIRRDYKIQKIAEITGIDRFYISKFKRIVDEEERLKKSSFDEVNKEWLLKLKKMGFSDKGLAEMLKASPDDIYNLRSLWNINASYKMVDTCAGEFEAVSPYYYSTYEMYDEVDVTDKKKVIVIGSGPIRIGQGIEFDYASVHSILSLKRLGYPVLVRPSYVLGGQGMEITYDGEELVEYLGRAFRNDSKNPVLIDKYLLGREIEVDAICDGEDVLIPGIMEHLERAGVHSGDSISIYPSQSISNDIREKILEYTKKITIGLSVFGMINIQFIEYKNELYIIEVNPRASRTVPYISKVSGVPIVDLATKAMLGFKLKDMGYGTGIYKEPELISIKVPVFSTQKLKNVEVSLGPEMKSTGEVLGIGKTFGEALYKGLVAAGIKLRKRGTILSTINDGDKEEFLQIAKEFAKAGFRFMATSGTAKFLKENGIDAEEVRKISEESPNILDIIKSGEVDLVIDTPTKGNDSNTDGFKIRRTASESMVTVITVLETAKAIAGVMSEKH